MHENVFAAFVALDEAKALLGIEELHLALAGADDLRGHAAATGAAEAATTAAATEAAATVATAAESTAITAAEAAATVAAAESAAVTTAESATIVTAAEAAATAAVGIEIVFAESVALIPSATPPPSVKTHKLQ
ncbi:hypothetical protein NMD1_02024 [Novosphingobium sp. MD-1]|nr:hypothetical protein NMD1_02024 [Novosphingobium sp. MD-1]